jgi:predicted ATPase/class 3 adenylate cyclase
MAESPTGTVTFLFTDLVGSTRLWEEHPDAMKDALARHDAILRGAVESHGGRVVKSRGDGVHAVFASALEALETCLDAQRALTRERWPEVAGALQVRMSLHAGEAEFRDGDYFGSVLNRAARLTSAAHGGQVLVSDSVEPLVRGALPAEVSLVDLGVHRLLDFSDSLRVFQLVHPELPGEFAPLRSLEGLPGNLPRPVTTFVGRDRELETVGELVRARPLVTLTGVGGVGKTRLALQVATEVATDFPDGVWWCDLAPVGDPAALWDVVAGTLGVPPPAGRPLDGRVLEYLAAKQLLMVLDNCEHLLDGVARLVDAVMRRCRGVAVLATSREGLALAGEQLVAVPSLNLPGEEVAVDALARADAVQLFVERARDARREFALTESNAPAVAQLCRRLDGIPLAIELAAARVRALSPQELVGRLDQRFRLLTRGSRAGLERHQTLRNTIDWSYELLDATERVALNRLSVFAGGCDLVAAEAVLSDGTLAAEDVADVLGQLVDKSLVVVDADDEVGTRYELSETIRQYAQEHLEANGAATELRRRHVEHFVAIAEEAGPRLRSRDQLACSTAVAREVDNLRAALDWAAEAGSADHALRIVAPLTVPGIAIGYAAMAWADTARAIPGAPDHELFPAVLAWAAWGKAMHGDLDLGHQLAAEAQAAQQRLGTRHLWVHMASATAALFTADLDRAHDHAEEWVRLARATGDPYELANALNMLAGTTMVSDFDAARPNAEEAVQVARDGGILTALTAGLAILAAILSNDDPEQAIEVLEEALEVGLLVGDRQSLTLIDFGRSWLAIRRRDWHTALRAALDSADQKRALGDMTGIRGVFGAASMALAGLQAHEPAAVLFGAKDPQGTEHWLQEVARAEAALVDRLGPDRFSTLQAQGAAMTVTDAVTYLHAEAERALSDH